MNIPDDLGMTSTLSLSALDSGDAIVSVDSKAAVNKERNCIMFSSSYQSPRLDTNECSLRALTERPGTRFLSDGRSKETT